MQANLATTARLLMVHDAIQKMLAFRLKRLDQVDIGDQDIPIAVRELEFPEIIAVIRRFHPFIVYLDLFKALDIVINRHLFTADNGHTPDLARIQPTNVDMSHNIVGKDHVDISHIMNAIKNAGRAVGTDRKR